MQKHRGLFHLRVYESAEGVAWFASFQRKRTIAGKTSKNIKFLPEVP